MDGGTGWRDGPLRVDLQVEDIAGQQSRIDNAAGPDTDHGVAATQFQSGGLGVEGHHLQGLQGPSRQLGIRRGHIGDAEVMELGARWRTRMRCPDPVGGRQRQAQPGMFAVLVGKAPGIAGVLAQHIADTRTQRQSIQALGAPFVQHLLAQRGAAPDEVQVDPTVAQADLAFQFVLAGMRRQPCQQRVEQHQQRRRVAL